jgi:hypothetical protein
MIGPCRLFLLSLIAINVAFSAHTPPSSPPRNAGKTPAGSPLNLPPKPQRGAYDPKRRGPTYVSSYTITQPHPDGRSVSSEQYSGKKIVDPVVHDRYTLARPNHLDNLIQSYHIERSMDETKYKKERQRHGTGMAALEEISNGNVVRHVGKGQTLLLHHNGISPDDAKYLAENDFAVDWTRTAEGYHIELTNVKKEYSHSKTVPQHLSEAERAAMHARLANNMREAHQHSQASKDAPKLYWNREVLSY